MSLKLILSAPKEELHQFFIGLYGDHLLPATMNEIEKILQGPDSIKGYNKNNAPLYTISKKQLKRVWKRLLDRLEKYGIITVVGHLRSSSKILLRPVILGKSGN